MTLRRIVLLDLILMVLLIAGALKVRRNWEDFQATHRVESVQAEPEIARGLPAMATASTASGDWNAIGSRNPFSFDRNDISIVAPKEVPQQTATPKPILFGTMQVGKEWIALLAPGPGGRQSRPMKVGDSMESWQVVEITESSVVMAANGVREKIVMNDPMAKVARDYSRTAGSAAAPNAPSPAAAAPPTAGNAPSPPSAPAPPPASAGGQKGHWVYTPFGSNFVLDSPQ